VPLDRVTLIQCDRGRIGARRQARSRIPQFNTANLACRGDVWQSSAPRRLDVPVDQLSAKDGVVAPPPIRRSA
jgi:hypothetical protein